MSDDTMTAEMTADVRTPDAEVRRLGACAG